MFDLKRSLDGLEDDIEALLMFCSNCAVPGQLTRMDLRSLGKLLCKLQSLDLLLLFNISAYFLFQNFKSLSEVEL